MGDDDGISKNTLCSDAAWCVLQPSLQNGLGLRMDIGPWRAAIGIYGSARDSLKTDVQFGLGLICPTFGPIPPLDYHSSNPGPTEKYSFNRARHHCTTQKRPGSSQAAWCVGA